MLPISEKQQDRVKELEKMFKDAGLRVSGDYRNEKIGYKIREAQMEKIPYMLVVGNKEVEDGTVSVRSRKGEDLGAMKPEDFLAKALLEINTKQK